MGDRGSGGGLEVCMLHLQIHINVPIYKKEIILSRNQLGGGVYSPFPAPYYYSNS